MTSVAVLSSAVTGIKCYEELRLPNEAIELGEVLEEIKNMLADAREAGGILPHDFLELEKEIVWHSYEIVDAIEDALLKPKTTLSVISRLFRRKEIGNPNLQNLQQRLKDIQHKFREMAPSPGPQPKHNQELPGSSVTQWENCSTTTGSQTGELLCRIKEDLLNPSSDSPEVYIVDEGCMAKTTLARRLFEDDDIRRRFNVFAWVPMKKHFRIKAVLQDIVQQLVPQVQVDIPRVDIREMNEIQLISHIFDGLKNKSLLIVIDDIGSMDHWSSLHLAFPLSSSHRFIITTSLDTFESSDHCYKISSLTLPQMQSLLEEQANFKPAGLGMEIVGEAIFDISGGSPILATILWKSLQSELAASSNQKLLLQELYSYKPHKGTPQVLGASYGRLDPELKACLLCMAQFPQGHIIPVDQLYLLLVAENLVSPKKDEAEFSLGAFEDGLEKLACSEFVEVQEDIVSTTGLPNCRLHDLVREFCILKVLDEEFLEIVEFDEEFIKIEGRCTRRLAIYLSKYKAGNCIQFDNQDKIASLLIFESAEDKPEWPPEIDDLKEFIHLRILNFDAVNFRVQKLPKGIDGLLLLRHLSFRGCWLAKLPSSMSRLTQLETLDLLVRAECNMFIPNIFCSMRRMLHLYLPGLYQTHGKLPLYPMESLEILVNFNTDVFDVSGLDDLKNLRIFSAICQGHSTDLNDVFGFLRSGWHEKTLLHTSLTATSYDCYNITHLDALRDLLQCEFLHSIHIEGQILELPEIPIHGQRVAEIVLDGSKLEHDPMSYLGRFYHLRSLVLSNDAFLGTRKPYRHPSFTFLWQTKKPQTPQLAVRRNVNNGRGSDARALHSANCQLCPLAFVNPISIFRHTQQG